jgi:uncharacterized membrane protein HdeD (DUF308 family)
MVFLALVDPKHQLHFSFNLVPEPLMANGGKPCFLRLNIPSPGAGKRFDNLPAAADALSRGFMNGYDEIRQHKGLFIGLGIVLIILGTIAIGTAMFTTLISVMLFGWLLLIGGVIESVHAFWVRPWSGLLLQLFMGVLSIIFGLLIVANPGASALALTLLMAAFFVVGGVFRIVTAAREHFPGRGWAIFSGCINVLLGILIWAHWPVSAFWVIGLFIGIDLLFTGWWFISLTVLTRPLISSHG